MIVIFPSLLDYNEQVEKAHDADVHCVDWNRQDDNLILTGYFQILNIFVYCGCDMLLSFYSDPCFALTSDEEIVYDIDSFFGFDSSGQPILLSACLIGGISSLMEWDHPFINLKVIKLLFFVCRYQ